MGELVEVYKSMVRLVVEYSSVVYHSLLTEQQSVMIETLQKQALKCIFGLCKEIFNYFLRGVLAHNERSNSVSRSLTQNCGFRETTLLSNSEYVTSYQAESNLDLFGLTCTLYVLILLLSNELLVLQ